MGRSWEPLLEQVVRERYARLLSYAVLMVGADDAPDVVQDALVSAFSGRARFTVAAEAEQYVRRAIAMRSIDTARRRRRSRALTDRLASLRQEVAHLEPTVLTVQVSEALADEVSRVTAAADATVYASIRANVYVHAHVVHSRGRGRERVRRGRDAPAAAAAPRGNHRSGHGPRERGLAAR